jgi:hypothetical protein
VPSEEEMKSCGVIATLVRHFRFSMCTLEQFDVASIFVTDAAARKNAVQTASEDKSSALPDHLVR